MTSTQIVGSIVTSTWQEFVDATNKFNSSIFEHRLDRLSTNELNMLNYNEFDCKVIVSCRLKQDNGYFSGSNEAKAKMLATAIEQGASYVDVEYNMPAQLQQELLKKAHLNSVKVIISFHDFHSTPDLDYLHNIAEQIHALGADFAKIITMAHSVQDSHRILTFLLQTPYKTIAFAMGKVGSYSRIICLLYGSPFTYASLINPTAEGQLTIEQTQRIIQNLGM